MIGQTNFRLVESENKQPGIRKDEHCFEGKNYFPQLFLRI